MVGRKSLVAVSFVLLARSKLVILILIENSRLVDDHRHARLAVLFLSAIDPDWRGVIHGNFEDEVTLSLGRLEAGEDASIRFNGHTRALKGGLDDGMVLGEVMKVAFVSRVGSHDVWREG